MKKRPEFEVIGWRNSDGGSMANALNEPQPKLVEQLKAKEPQFEDDIPF
jgi:hypothetical protein